MNVSYQIGLIVGGGVGDYSGNPSRRHYISVLEASLQTLVRFQAVSQPAVIGSPIGWPQRLPGSASGRPSL